MHVELHADDTNRQWPLLIVYLLLNYYTSIIPKNRNRTSCVDGTCRCQCPGSLHHMGTTSEAHFVVPCLAGILVKPRLHATH